MTIRDVNPKEFVSKYYAYTTSMFSKKLVTNLACSGAYLRGLNVEGLHVMAY